MKLYIQKLTYKNLNPKSPDMTSYYLQTVSRYDKVLDPAEDPEFSTTPALPEDLQGYFDNLRDIYAIKDVNYPQVEFIDESSFFCRIY